MASDSPKKEWVLNMAFNRWQFNRPKFVGFLAQAIRSCGPSSPEEWEKYYKEEVPRKHVPMGWVMLGSSMEEHLTQIGLRLYAKISEQLRAEVEAITPEDCIKYVHEVVIRRTYEGYVREKRTIYDQLEEILGLPIHPAPDEWDRKYNVDFYIAVGQKFIGLQIKPITYEQTPEVHKWKEWMQDSHRAFEKDKGGKVFVVYSLTELGSKCIANEEVIADIRKEIERLRSTS